MTGSAEVGASGGGSPDCRPDGARRPAPSLTGALWLACVLPLVPLGYGSDPDAWRVARTAWSIAETGRYMPSRTTGFPLYELLVTPAILLGGWVASNLLSVAAGAALLALLSHLSRKGAFRHGGLAVVAVAFLPVVLKNASSTMDYLPALALIFGSFVALRGGRPDLGALLLGLAAGFRPSSAAFALPALVFLGLQGAGARALVRFSGIAAGAAALAYSPALLVRGVGVPVAGGGIFAPGGFVIGGYRASQLLGLVQSIAVAALLVRAAWRTARTSAPEPERRSEIAYHVAALATTAAMFALLPDEPEYLLPAVPSLVLLLDRLCTRREMALAVAALLSYHAFRVETLGGESGRRRIEVSIREGYLVSDVLDRVYKLSLRRVATEARLDRPTVLMEGSPFVQSANEAFVVDRAVGLPRQRDGNLYLAGRITEPARLDDLRARGFRLVAWSGRKAELDAVPGLDWRERVEVVDDLEAFFGRPISGRPLQ